MDWYNFMPRGGSKPRLISLKRVKRDSIPPHIKDRYA